MTRLDAIPDRAMQLASQVGDNVRHLVPAHAGKLLEAGVALGALKTGTRAAGKFVRRNPAVVVAAAAGAGALWYLARRRAKQAENGNTNGSGNSKRVAAKRVRKAAKSTKATASSD